MTKDPGTPVDTTEEPVSNGEALPLGGDAEAGEEAEEEGEEEA